MDLAQSIILGLIQGLTEWLPISSTGHLRIAEHFFGLSVPLLFDVTLHLGTLLVTLVYFRKDIINVLSALWHRNLQSESGKLILPVIIGSIPTALIAFLIGNDLDTYFSTLLLLGTGFIAGGIVLSTSKFGTERKSVIGYSEAFFLGLMQGIAIIPSISRSGLTIAVSLLLGVKKELAFKFSFLLSIPAVIGALGLTLYQEHSTFSLASITPLEIAAAIAVTVAVSFFSLKLLWKSLTTKKFYLFSLYCLILGFVLVVSRFLGF